MLWALTAGLAAAALALAWAAPQRINIAGTHAIDLSRLRGLPFTIWTLTARFAYR